MMNTIYPNEGAQLHVNGAEAKPGMNMEGLLLSNLGVFFSSSQTPSCRVIKQEIQLRFGSISTVEGKVQGGKSQIINMAHHLSLKGWYFLPDVPSQVL